MQEPMRHLIRRTYLSRKPAAGGLHAAALSFAVFMLFYLFYHRDLGSLSAWVAATPDQVFARHQFWRAFTAPAVHADPGHFLANSFFFCGLAFMLNGYFGAWVFPVLAWASAAVIHVLALATYPPTTTLVGASGAVYF